MASQSAKQKIDTTTQLNLFQRLAKIRRMASVIQTNKRGYGYTYVSEDKILSQITAGMEKYHVSLIPHIINDTTEVTKLDIHKTKATKKGDIYEDVSTEMLVKSDGYFRWICDDDPDSFYDVPWVIVGQQSDVSQALGSGLTYCTRYFLLKFFNVATVEDDPDKWRQEQKESLDMENKGVASKIAEEITVVINECKASLGEKDSEKFRDDLAEFFKERITVNGKKSPNYLAVTDPLVLAKVLDELREFVKNYTKKDTEEETK